MVYELSFLQKWEKKYRLYCENTNKFFDATHPIKKIKIELL